MPPGRGQARRAHHFNIVWKKPRVRLWALLGGPLVADRTMLRSQLPSRVPRGSRAQPREHCDSHFPDKGARKRPALEHQANLQSKGKTRRRAWRPPVWVAVDACTGSSATSRPVRLGCGLRWVAAAGYSRRRICRQTRPAGVLPLSVFRAGNSAAGALRGVRRRHRANGARVAAPSLPGIL